MDAKDLPSLDTCILVAASADYDELDRKLHQHLGHATFGHMDVIRNMPRSGRILLVTPTETSVPLHRLHNFAMIVNELQQLEREARYDPPEPPSLLDRRGWTLYIAPTDDAITLIIFATWIS